MNKAKLSGDGTGPVGFVQFSRSCKKVLTYGNRMCYAVTVAKSDTLGKMSGGESVGEILEALHTRDTFYITLCVPVCDSSKIKRSLSADIG